MSGKRIILLSDGTGNSASKVWKSNVWRVFESLDLRGSEQVAFYDDGVGTSSFKPLAILGGVFGWGLKRNVLDICKFLCLNYKEGDQIFAFGFSRGAFTIRVLIGLVLSQNLVTGVTDAEVYRNAKMAYRAYRRERVAAEVSVAIEPQMELEEISTSVVGLKFSIEFRPLMAHFGRSAMSQLSLLSAPERTWIILKIVDVGCP
jgi:uncharacterized protein (DUF2235 family)